MLRTSWRFAPEGLVATARSGLGGPRQSPPKPLFRPSWPVPLRSEEELARVTRMELMMGLIDYQNLVDTLASKKKN